VVHSLFADGNLQISTNAALGVISHMNGWTDECVNERLREITGGLYPHVRLLMESCRRRSAGVPVVDRMYGRLAISQRSLDRLDSGREPLICFASFEIFELGLSTRRCLSLAAGETELASRWRERGCVPCSSEQVGGLDGREG
jgi:hypothetical protein